MGRPGGGVLCPHACRCACCAGPRGGGPRLGAARRRGCVAPPQDLLCLPWTNLADQAGGAFGAAASRRRPQAGGQPQRRMPRRPGPRHGPAAPPSCTVSQTNLPDQAGGAFGAAASRRRPQAGGQPQRRMPRRPGPRHGPAKPAPIHHPTDRIQTWPLGGRHSRRPAQLCTKQLHRCTVSQTNLADQAGGAFGAAASRRRPQAGGQPQRRMPRRPGSRHGPAKPAPLNHPATPPDRSHPNLASRGRGCCTHSCRDMVGRGEASCLMRFCQPKI